MSSSVAVEEVKWNVSASRAEDAEPNAPFTITVSNSEDENTKYSYPIQFVNDVAYPAWCPPSRWQMLNSALETRYRPTDVLVVSYPKCGTTWAEQCAVLLLHKGDKSLMNPAHKNVYVPGTSFVGKIWPEACIAQAPHLHERVGAEFAPITMEDFDSAPSPRVIKSHAPVSHLLGTSGKGVRGLPEGTKVVVVTRNPLDACVSSYYHAWNPAKSGWPFSAWASAWLSGNVPHGDWFDWVKTWAQHSKENPGRVHWVQFEDLKSDPDGTVQKLADYLGVGDDADLVKIAAVESSFENMKEQASSKGGDQQGHLRKGVSGDWRNHFSPDVAQTFIDRYKEKMVGTGLTFSLGQGEDNLTAPL